MKQVCGQPEVQKTLAQKNILKINKNKFRVSYSRMRIMTLLFSPSLYENSETYTILNTMGNKYNNMISS